jgi:hypothetical protein
MKQNKPSNEPQLYDISTIIMNPQYHTQPQPKKRCLNKVILREKQWFHG